MRKNHKSSRFNVQLWKVSHEGLFKNFFFKPVTANTPFSCLRVFIPVQLILLQKKLSHNLLHKIIILKTCMCHIYHAAQGYAPSKNTRQLRYPFVQTLSYLILSCWICFFIITWTHLNQWILLHCSHLQNASVTLCSNSVKCFPCLYTFH